MPYGQRRAREADGLAPAREEMVACGRRLAQGIVDGVDDYGDKRKQAARRALRVIGDGRDRHGDEGGDEAEAPVEGSLSTHSAQEVLEHPADNGAPQCA